MSDDAPGHPAARDEPGSPAAENTPPHRPRSASRMWEAIVGVSTAAGVVVALVVGLPNLLHHDPPAPVTTVLIARECCVGVTPSYYVQGDSTQMGVSVVAATAFCTC